jgi:hypothetical protein
MGLLARTPPSCKVPQAGRSLARKKLFRSDHRSLSHREYIPWRRNTTANAMLGQSTIRTAGVKRWEWGKPTRPASGDFVSRSPPAPPRTAASPIWILRRGNSERGWACRRTFGSPQHRHESRRHHGRDIEESQGGGQQLVEGAVQAVGVIVSIFPDADDGRQPRPEAGAWPAVPEDLSRKVWELVIPIFDGCPVIHEVGYDEGACSSSVRRVPTRRALKGD